MDEQNLIEKLRRIEALHAGATTPGERIAAANARDLYDCKIVEPTVSLPSVYDNFLNLVNELFRPERRLGRLKEFTHYFAKNYKFGHQLGSRVQSSSSMDEARERAGMFFENGN